MTAGIRPMRIVRMRLIGKLCMPHFVTLLSRHNRTVLYGNDEVVWRAPKMLTDGDSVF